MLTALLALSTASAGVPVDCVQSEGQPWCTATVTVDASAATIDVILADLEGLPGIFPRIESATLLEPMTIYVVLEMPFPLAPRDYIAAFSRAEQDGEIQLRWSAVEHPDAPPDGRSVRLIHTAGTWTLKPISPTQTAVTYYWNAALGGDVPTWALPRAWQMQGDEVLGRLKAAAESAAE